MTLGRLTKDRIDRKKTLAANGSPYGNDRILDIESRSTRSHSVVNWLWKSQWTLPKTGYGTNEVTSPGRVMSSELLPHSAVPRSDPRIFSAYPGHEPRTYNSCITGGTFRFDLWPRLLRKAISRSCSNDLRNGPTVKS